MDMCMERFVLSSRAALECGACVHTGRLRAIFYFFIRIFLCVVAIRSYNKL